MELEVLCQPDFEKSSHFSEATQLAHELVDYARSISDAINRANTPGASSRVIQELFVPRAEDLGFSSERKGLFTKYKTSRLRPDFYKSLGRGAGILLEVERGKTTDNNMDLLDYWKCHICEEANVLFLFVPSLLQQNESGSPRAEFRTVYSRLATFFEPGNETSVQAVFLFGY